MPTIKLKTPAKVNLLLNIIRKKLDNYHEIETIFQAIDLFDVIEIDYKESNETNIKIKTNITSLPRDSSNLAYKAAVKFLEEVNKKADILIMIKKNIPISAGLGGGSSDAACVIKALNKINSYPVHENALMNIAYSLGADVTFFLKGGTAIGKGIGEKLTQIKSPELSFVILKPRDLEIKSGWAYEKYDLLSIKPTVKKLSDVVTSIETNNTVNISNNVFNSLEYAVFKECPILKKHKEELIKLGCYNAMLSGSGPTIFGIVKNLDEAEKIKEKMENNQVEVLIAKSISSESKID